MKNYLSKKTEKIISATYLVTGFIKDTDPIKWEIRENCMSLISSVSAIDEKTSVDKSHLLQSFFSSACEIISLIKIVSTAGMVSEMNSSILIKEIESLIEFVKKQSEYNTHQAGFILSDNFFETHIQVDDVKINGESHEDASKMRRNIQKDKINIKDKKNSRQDNILDLLRKSSNLTIKDFTKIITGCSEKTIQRELLDLVKNGIVKKIGERRWSTYSLV